MRYRFKPLREHYMPENATLHRQEHGLTVFFYEKNEWFYAIGFRQTAQRPAWSHQFLSQELREKFLVEEFARAEAFQKRLKEMRQANAAVPAEDHYKVGDILYCTWGWEQTNVDFYQITNLRGKMLEFRKVMDESTADGNMSGTVVPRPGMFVEREPVHSRPARTTHVPFGRHSLTKWNGRPVRFSSYA